MSIRLETRVKELERELSMLKRGFAMANQRVAAPMMPRLGRHLAKLTETLLPLAEADAIIQVWSKGILTDGPTVTIRDLTLGTDESWPVDTLLWIVWDKTTWTWIGVPTKQDTADHYAWLIGFTISETTGGLMRDSTFAGTGMFATVDYIADGSTPPLNGDSELIVYDDQDMAPLAVRNCKGWAWRNEHLGATETPRYQIIACDQMAVQGRAILAQTMEGFLDFDVAIHSFQPDSEQPLGAMPIAPYASHAFNPHGRRAPNGTPVLLRWGSVAGDPNDPFGNPQFGYIIESVETSGLRLPINFRVNQSTKAIECQRVLMVVETTQTELANIPWEPMFPNKDC